MNKKYELFKKIEKILFDGETTGEFNSNLDWIQHDTSTGIKVRVIHGEWKSIRAININISPNKHDEYNPFRKTK